MAEEEEKKGRGRNKSGENQYKPTDYFLFRQNKSLVNFSKAQKNESDALEQSESGAAIEKLLLAGTQ